MAYFSSRSSLRWGGMCRHRLRLRVVSMAGQRSGDPGGSALGPVAAGGRSAGIRGDRGVGLAWWWQGVAAKAGGLHSWAASLEWMRERGEFCGCGGPGRQEPGGLDLKERLEVERRVVLQDLEEVRSPGCGAFGRRDFSQEIQGMSPEVKDFDGLATARLAGVNGVQQCTIRCVDRAWLLPSSLLRHSLRGRECMAAESVPNNGFSSGSPKP